MSETLEICCNIGEDCRKTALSIFACCCSWFNYFCFTDSQQNSISVVEMIRSYQLRNSRHYYL